MYGAIHRAQCVAASATCAGSWSTPRCWPRPSFRVALTDAPAIATVDQLEHPNIVPTVAVESGGPDVVVVTRGVGRYVTVQDLIAAARANRRQGGKLPLPVAGGDRQERGRGARRRAQGAGVVHGAVHPRSVLVDEDGARPARRLRRSAAR